MLTCRYSKFIDSTVLIGNKCHTLIVFLNEYLFKNPHFYILAMLLVSCFFFHKKRRENKTLLFQSLMTAINYDQQVYFLVS